MKLYQYTGLSILASSTYANSVEFDLNSEHHNKHHVRSRRNPKPASEPESFGEASPFDNAFGNMAGRSGNVGMDMSAGAHNFQDLPEHVEKFIKGVLQWQTQRPMMRMVDDLNKMAFWAVVMGTVFDMDGITFPVTDEEAASIHVDPSMSISDVRLASDINLQASHNWFVENYTGHGCYCWPEDRNKLTGFGMPRDTLDEACHNLYTCYVCVRSMDECRDERINPQRSDYACTFLSQNNSTLDVSCDNPKNSNCLRALCECDKKFIIDAARATKDDANKDAFHQGQCIENVHDVKKKCCGDWPDVVTYNDQLYCCDGTGNTHEWSSLVGIGGQCEGEWDQPDLEDMFISLPYDADAKGLKP